MKINSREKAKNSGTGYSNFVVYKRNYSVEVTRIKVWQQYQSYLQDRAIILYKYEVFLGCTYNVNLKIFLWSVDGCQYISRETKSGNYKIINVEVSSNCCQTGNPPMKCTLNVDDSMRIHSVLKEGHKRETFRECKMMRWFFLTFAVN